MKSIAALFIAVAVLFTSGCRRPSEADHVKLAQQVVRDINEGDFADVRAKFDDTMDVSLSQEQLQQLWRNFTQAKGEFQSQGGPEVAHRGRITIVMIPVDMSKQEGQVRVAVNSDGKVAGLYFLNADAPLP